MPKPASGNVTTLNLVQLGDDRRVMVSKVLKDAKKQKLDEIMVVGRTDDGKLWCQSSRNAGQSLWLLEKMREHLLGGNPWSIV